MNVLCKSFRVLNVGGKVLTAGFHVRAEIGGKLPGIFIPLTSKVEESAKSESSHGLEFSPRSIGLEIPMIIQPTRSIIGEPTLGRISNEISDPRKIINLEDDVSKNNPLELPTLDNAIEKQAVRMVVIKKHKMRVHKLRKLRKRMKFYWAKLRHKREKLKEKRFKDNLIARIKAAEAFDAKEYVAKKINFLTKERLPLLYRGELIPETMMRQFLEEKRKWKEYKRNKRFNRLTL